MHAAFDNGPAKDGVVLLRWPGLEPTDLLVPAHQPRLNACGRVWAKLNSLLIAGTRGNKTQTPNSFESWPPFLGRRPVQVAAGKDTLRSVGNGKKQKKCTHQYDGKVESACQSPRDGLPTAMILVWPDFPRPLHGSEANFGEFSPPSSRLHDNGSQGFIALWADQVEGPQTSSIRGLCQYLAKHADNLNNLTAIILASKVKKIVHDTHGLVWASIGKIRLSTRVFLHQSPGPSLPE
ncbi:hypothetical protein PG985_006306 [Apiospora marii]|uniref:Uncharacterized protein n=1 Tax=Apiospora marii TaxID=335849 RepID=A0ABR1S780_9PEZI